MATTECIDNGKYYRQWPIDDPKAVVMLVHGLGEHCARYDALASLLNKRGYAVSSMDLPNHGKSQGQYGDIESFDLFSQAALGLYARIQNDYKNKDVILLGHSMGGLISTNLLVSHQDKFKCAALSAPAIESPAPPPTWQVALIKFIAKWFPKAGMLALDGNLVSRDPAMVKAYFADPLISSNKLSARLLLAFTNAMNAVKLDAHKINLPLLIMHGEADRLTAPSGSQWLHDNVSSEDKTLKLYPELFHEIFNEPEGPEIHAELADWLDSQLAKAVAK